MIQRIRRRLPLVLLLICCLGMTSSCSLLGPIIGLPIRVAGGALKMVTSNPAGAAAAAAAVF